MKLYFTLRGIPTNKHDQFERARKWKTPVTRFNELRDYKLTRNLTINAREEILVNNIVLFFEKGGNTPLNKNWGWREYRLKKL